VPELPEVETVVRDLRPFLTGCRIASIASSRKALRKPWKKQWNATLRNLTINAVERRGKWIVCHLDGERRLVFHLGMSGQLKVVDAAAERESHTHLIFDFGDGSRQLRFRDIRRFGSATLYETTAALETFFTRAKLGPEPFVLDAAYWREQLANTSRSLKAVLLDQRVVAGVGNIYADETLFQAKLHPQILGRVLDAAAADRLRRAITTVLTRAIECRGSSIRNYVGGDGLQGGYQQEFRVYGRTGEPCNRCGTAIERIRLAGRSTHYCPQCQNLRTSPKSNHG
jgi:formamidopyrimidine-DNA glycosylase